MSNSKEEFYRVLNEIIGNERLTNEEAYIINDYVSSLEATYKKQQKEIERLNNIIENIEKYIRYWNRKGISQNTMLILNDILLIKNGMSDKVVRLKEK